MNKERLQADTAYQARFQEIEKALERLNENLRTHRERHKQDPKNWALAGSLYQALKIIEQAEQILAIQINKEVVK